VNEQEGRGNEMKYTEFYIPFTEKLRKVVGFDKEIPPEMTVFRCLRFNGSFVIDPDDLAGSVSDAIDEIKGKYNKALLYSDKGLWQKLAIFENRDDIYKKAMEMAEGELPEGYFLYSVTEDRRIAVFGYEDRIEAIFERDGRTKRISQSLELEMDR